MIDTQFFENKRVAFFTLGCKLNFAETSYLVQALHEEGMITAAEGEQADLCLINTCSVTDVADKKCRQLIRRIHRQHPKAKIVVTGCYAQLEPEEVAGIEGVDLVLGAGQKGDLVKYVRQMGHAGTMDGVGHILHSPIGDVRAFAPSVSSEGRTRHFLKVQDGCDYHCSYCTIPMARGRSRNGRIEDLVGQAKQVAEEGGREIVLTGVNVGDFGRSTGESFIDLVRALDQVEGIDRFRISSIEPNLITDEVIDFVAHSRRFAPHFHIPLQSGSNAVLKLMRRRYKREVFAHKIAMIKELMPDAFIGVDVIVGTRGETEEYFQESYDFINTLPISQLHVFSYSERPGTDALKIDHVVSPQQKHERSQRLLALSSKLLDNFYESQLGTTRKLLIEHSDADDYLYGFTENYVRVRIPFVGHVQGEVHPVFLSTRVEDDPQVIAGRLL